MDRRQGHTGGLPHVNCALLRQVHMVEVDKLKLGLLFRPVDTNQWNGNILKEWPRLHDIIQTSLQVVEPAFLTAGPSS